MRKLLIAAPMLVILGCGANGPKDSGSSDSGSSTDSGTAADAGDDSGSVPEPPADSCVKSTDLAANDAGFGLPCTPHGGECLDTARAKICTVDFVTTDSWFCTGPCGSDSDCGGGGVRCIGDPCDPSGQKGCVPPQCLPGGTPVCPDAGNNDGGSNDAGNITCNTIANSAPLLTTRQVAAPLPAPLGGLVASGSYQLSDATQYTGVGGTTGPSSDSTAESLVYDGVSTVQLANRSSDGGTSTTTATVSFSGAQLTFTKTCPSSQSPQSTGYSADGGAFAFYGDHSTIYTFTKH